MHLFWLTLAVPAVILLQWVLPVMKQRSIWSISFMIVGLMTLVWLAMGLITLEANHQNVQGISTMIIFRLISSTDLPLIQLLVACAVGWLRSDTRELYRAKPDFEVTAEQPVLG